MNKFRIVLLVCLILLSFSGCGGAGETEEFIFIYQGTAIAMHAEADPILAALGEPKGYTEEASCAFEGMDKTYHYGSFCLSTYPKAGRDYVQSVWFLDDSVATAEGLYLGSTQDQAAQACGEDSFNGTNAYIRTGETSRLTVLITDGTVSSIQYSAVH